MFIIYICESFIKEYVFLTTTKAQKQRFLCRGVKMNIEKEKELESWKEMCSEIQKVFSISKEDFNKREDIRKLCVKISNWGYWNTELSNKMKRNKPIFCDVI